MSVNNDKTNEELMKKQLQAAAAPTPGAAVPNTAAGMPGSAENTLPGINAAAVGAAKQNVTYVDDNGQKQPGVMETPQNVEDFSYWDSMREYYEKMYADQVKANNTAAANQTAFILGEVNKQIEAVGQKYKSTNMQLYQDYMANRKSLPQILAANGYTGGLSESSRINMETGYQNQLAQNQRARINEENTLNSNFLRSQYEAQAAADAANAQALQQKYGHLAQLQQQQYAEEQNNLKARAEQLALSGDFSGFLALGYNQSQVDYMTRVFLQQNPKLLDVWMKSHPEEAARLGLTTPSAGGGYGRGAVKTKGDYVSEYNFLLENGDEKGAVAKLEEYVASPAFDGGGLGATSAAEYNYYKNLAG